MSAPRATALTLLLSACAPDAGLSDLAGPGPRPSTSAAQPSAGGAVEFAYVDELEQLVDGVRLESSGPFLSFTVALTAPEDSRFSFRVPNADGSLGDWQPLVIDEDLGPYRNGHQVLEQAVDFVELRATGAASFVQVTFREGVDMLHDDDEADTSTARQATAGMWELAYDSWLLGQAQYLPYQGASSCTGSLSAGARELGDFLVEHFEASSYGGYNCRTIGSSSTLSVHSEGRAIDLYVPMDGSGRDAAANDLGDPIAQWLVENAEHIGISYVIWDQASWGAHRGGDKHRSYGGAHPHNNHLHIELTWNAAFRVTDWYADPDATVPDGTEPDETEPDDGDDGDDGDTGQDPVGDIYMVGDWDGDGRDNLAVRRDDSVYMDTNFDGLADIVQLFGHGDAEDGYLVGDWDTQGRDHLAVRRGDTVLMDTDGGGNAELQQQYGDGASEDQYLVGDWDGDGDDDLAVRRDDTVYMDTNDDGLADIVQLYGNGDAEDEYLVGDWDGDGRDNLAVRRGDTLYLDTNFSGGAERVRMYGNGATEDQYLVGDWDGDGDDDLAVRRGDTVWMDTTGDGLADLTQMYGDG
jgi:hypothetical protein